MLIAYLRLKDADIQIQFAFVMGKTKLAPVREISIPRLELTAAVVSVKLSNIIRGELDMTIQDGLLLDWFDVCVKVHQQWIKEISYVWI